MKIRLRWPSLSIRTRLILLLVFLTVLSSVTTPLFNYFVTEVTSRYAQTVSSQALTQQAETYLVQITQSSARANDQALAEVLRETGEIAEYLRQVFEAPASSMPGWSASEHMTTLDGGQFANGEQDPTSVFVPNTVDVDEQTIFDIERSAGLDAVLPGIFKNTPNVEAIYFATPREMVRYYPNVNLGAVLPPDFQASQRPWYTGSTRENNPSAIPWWTAPYVDATGRGLVTTAAIPVYNSSNTLLGVVGLDLTLNSLRQTIEETRLLTTGYSFLIDRQGRAIAMPEQAFQDILNRTAGEGEINVDLLEAEGPFSPVLADMVAGESGFTSIDVGSKALYIAYAPLPSTGWSLGSVVESSEVLGAVATLEQDITTTTERIVVNRILPIGIGVLVLAAILGLVLANRLIRPLQALATETEKIGRGDYDINVPTERRDEIGSLSRAFSSMVAQIREFIQSLEDRVAERTADLERRTSQVQVASEIAREAAAIRDPAALMEHAINLIRDRFGFYHAGLFLLDEKGEYAILRSATGEAGRQMLARGHRLKVGEVGMVGRVTGTGQPRVALDVTTDETHYKNPLLPQTRAEMVLPLQIGPRIIGALDVQSTQPNAFTPEDVTILQTLADQIAIAIENARLIQESQENLRKLEALYASYSQEAWQKLGEGRNTVGYRFDPSGVHPLRQSDVMAAGSEEGELPAISIPLELRGQVIANLDVWPGPEGLDNEEIELLRSIADRLSQAMDSARLFEEAQQRARSERVVSEITTRMRETLDIDSILRTAAREMRRSLNLAEVEIRLGNAPTPKRRGNGHSGEEGNDAQ